MAFDMSDVLTDPELTQAIPVARATETVDEKGRTQLVQQNFTAHGVIHPATPEQLERLAEADRSNETIAIYATTLLTSGTNTLAPDTVTWSGGTYKVMSVLDYMAFGYCEALAVSDTMQGKEVA